MSDDTDSQKLFEPKYPIVTIEDEMRDSYLEYAMSVIVGRALPDVRDGLKACPPACPLCHGCARK